MSKTNAILMRFSMILDLAPSQQVRIVLSMRTACDPKGSSKFRTVSAPIRRPLLFGIETWVRIPRDQFPAEYQHLRDPVFRLVLALYGHPDAGTSWEAWCTDKLASKGFRQVSGWPNVFVHARLQIIASVYVDDFKVSGLERDVAEAWRLIGDVIEMEPAEAFSKYLGCHHRRETMELDQKEALWRYLPLYGNEGGKYSEAPIR